jgi:UDP-4-amino-4,6-dideoxy-N-acetyl-beta-L-altrosamine transaminase
LNKKSNFLGYGQQSISEEDIRSVENVLRDNYLTQGPIVERFESALAERVGAKYAVACSSGTAGLHLACLAAGLPPGSKGITTTMSFAASANCMLYTKINVDLLDIDEQSLNLSPDLLNIYIDANEVDLVIPVHFAGLAAKSAKIRNICGNRIVIEDACHSLGGSYENGSPVGCGEFSDMSVFSFHPVKPITTGEGGAIATNNPDLAKRLKLYRNHGIERNSDNFINLDAKESGHLPWYYEQQALGFNYRLTEIQAALGLSQLQKLENFRTRRREIARFYDTELKHLPLSLTQASPDDRKRSGHHLYIIRVDWNALGLSRADVMLALRQKEIGSQVHYIPIHQQPFHAPNFVDKLEHFPNAQKYYSECLSIPLFPEMTQEDAKRVVDTLSDVLGAA